MFPVPPYFQSYPCPPVTPKLPDALPIPCCPLSKMRRKFHVSHRPEVHRVRHSSGQQRHSDSWFGHRIPGRIAPDNSGRSARQPRPVPGTLDGHVSYLLSQIDKTLCRTILGIYFLDNKGYTQRIKMNKSYELASFISP